MSNTNSSKWLLLADLCTPALWCYCRELRSRDRLVQHDSSHGGLPCLCLGTPMLVPSASPFLTENLEKVSDRAQQPVLADSRTHNDRLRGIQPDLVRLSMHNATRLLIHCEGQAGSRGVSSAKVIAQSTGSYSATTDWGPARRSLNRCRALSLDILENQEGIPGPFVPSISPAEITQTPLKVIDISLESEEQPSDRGKGRQWDGYTRKVIRQPDGTSPVPSSEALTKPCSHTNSSPQRCSVLLRTNRVSRLLDGTGSLGATPSPNLRSARGPSQRSQAGPHLVGQWHGRGAAHIVPTGQHTCHRPLPSTQQERQGPGRHG